MMVRLVIAIVSIARLLVSAAHGETIGFGNETPGIAPAGFTVALTGGGEAPKWEMQKAPESEGPNVVAQTSRDTTNYRFPLLVYDSIEATDLDLSVNFRTIAGRVDQAAGLVWRYRDPNNYYVARANALEGNVVLYKVEKGGRSDLPLKGKGRTYGANAPVPKNAWNALEVQVRRHTFTVSLNGNILYEVEDGTFEGPGKAGLWTKADSVTMFRDLVITAIK